MPGQISGKFGDLSESKFLENFVPGVSVCLPLSVSPSLFPCLRIYLFRNLCLSLSIFVHLCIPICFFLVFAHLCLYLSVCVSLSLGLSRFVSVCLYVSVSVVRLYFFASFCVSLSISACPRLSIWVLFVYICLCLFFSICLRLFLWVGSQRWHTSALPRAASPPFQAPLAPLRSVFLFLSDCYYYCSCLLACLLPSFSLSLSFSFSSLSFSLNLVVTLLTSASAVVFKQSVNRCSLQLPTFLIMRCSELKACGSEHTCNTSAK